MCNHKECLKREAHKPGECTPEQIRECHGDVLEHPCIGSEKQEKK